MITPQLCDVFASTGGPHHYAASYSCVHYVKWSSGHRCVAWWTESRDSLMHTELYWALDPITIICRYGILFQLFKAWEVLKRFNHTHMCCKLPLITIIIICSLQNLICIIVFAVINMTYCVYVFYTVLTPVAVASVPALVTLLVHHGGCRDLGDPNTHYKINIHTWRKETVTIA